MVRETTTTRRHHLPFGADWRREATTFRIHAPLVTGLGLEIAGRSDGLAMEAEGGGWYRLVVEGLEAGARYRFLLPGGERVPDPASRFLPDDVHGWSEVIDPESFVWSDGDWRGRAWREAVIYEMHVGAFTAAGTFLAAIERLDHLAALGVTAVQLMPIGAFPGGRNWGYDGVQPFAPDRSYGRPEDLKRFVEAAHRRGLQVFLDVVYNHFGPEGNFLPLLSPIFTERHRSPWGAGLDFDGDDAPFMRSFVIENALYWLTEYHMDGLRFDAVHAIVDDSPRHVIDEIADRVRAAFPDRTIHLVLENEENEARRLERHGNFPVLFTAQWNDDVHHVLHTAITGEDAGYYADYAGDTDKLGRALAEGFAFQGETMPYRGTPRGEPSAGLPPTAFVAFLQNHDQIGNRAFGDRLSTSAMPEAIRAATAVVMLSPQIPMLFMGEEWGATAPFPFFCGFTGDLAEAVREGRRREFERFPAFKDPARRETIPDPTDEATFRSAKLDWAEAAREPHSVRLDWMRRLIAVRRLEIAPRLVGIEGYGGAWEVVADRAIVVRWRLGDGSRYRLYANIGADPVRHAVRPEERIVWAEGRIGPDHLGPRSALFTLHPPA